MTRPERVDLRALTRTVYYLACVVVPLLGVFVLGKAWFAVAIAMCLGAPLVNRLARDSVRAPVDPVADSAAQPSNRSLNSKVRP